MSDNISNLYYTSDQILYKNSSDIWKNSITIVNTCKKNSLFELHPTGYADLDGRKYIALPKGTNVKDPKIIKKYNLI
jgi:hypothetical protein